MIVYWACFALCASFPGLKLSDVPVRSLVQYVFVVAKTFLVGLRFVVVFEYRAFLKRRWKNTWCYVGNMKYNTIGTSSLAAEGKKSTLTIYAEADSTRDKVRICIFTKPSLGLRKFCLYCCLTFLSANLQLSRLGTYSSIWFYWPNSKRTSLLYLLLLFFVAPSFCRKIHNSFLSTKKKQTCFGNRNLLGQSGPHIVHPRLNDMLKDDLYKEALH